MNILRIAVCISALATAQAAWGAPDDVVVITNKGNDNSVDKSLVQKIYLGESKQWAGGGAIVAFDLPEDSATRASFDTGVLGKSVGNMKALSAQNMFSGKALPPKTVASDEDVKKAVAANKAAIGYIKSGSVDATVKVAFGK